MLYDKNIATFMLQLCYDKNSRQTLANHRLEACNFVKKETLAQVFSCEFCEIYKNTFYYRTPLVAASGVIINFAILEPFSNKVAGIFSRIPMVAPSDFSLQQILFCSWTWYLLLTVAPIFENKS